ANSRTRKWGLSRASPSPAREKTWTFSMVCSSFHRFFLQPEHTTAAGGATARLFDVEILNFFRSVFCCFLPVKIVIHFGHPAISKRYLHFHKCRSTLVGARVPSASLTEKKGPTTMRHSSEIDMCSGPLAGSLLRFSIPLMASSILQLLFNAADIIVL